MLLAITLLECRHRGLRLLHRDAGLQSAYATHETVAAHDALFRRVWIIERRRDKNLRVAAEPRDRQVRQNANDRVSYIVQCNASPDYTRIGAQAFAPKTFRHKCNVVFHFFLLKKVAAENRMDA